MQSAELRIVCFEWRKPCLQLSPGFVNPDWDQGLEGPYAEIGVCPCLERCVFKPGEVIHLGNKTPCGKDSSPIGLRRVGTAG